MKRFKGCLGVFLIFFLGVVAGGILASGAIYAKVWELIEGGPDKVAEFTLKRLNDELKLDDVQRREFNRISDRTRLRLRAVRYSHQAEVEAALDENDVQSVRSMLEKLVSGYKPSDVVDLVFRERETDTAA